MNLLASLNLDDVSADTNAIPANTYEAIVSKVAYVNVASKNEVAHVITYKVVSGSYKGATLPHWFAVGSNPQWAGEPGKSELKGYTPTMTDQAKQWYKKAFVDLGVSETAITTFDPESLVGTAINLTVKVNTSNGKEYRNVNGVSLRKGGTGFDADADQMVDATAPKSFDEIDTTDF